MYRGEYGVFIWSVVHSFFLFLVTLRLAEASSTVVFSLSSSAADCLSAIRFPVFHGQTSEHLLSGVGLSQNRSISEILIWNHWRWRVNQSKTLTAIRLFSHLFSRQRKTSFALIVTRKVRFIFHIEQFLLRFPISVVRNWVYCSVFSVWVFWIRPCVFYISLVGVCVLLSYSWANHSFESDLFDESVEPGFAFCKMIRNPVYIGNHWTQFRFTMFSGNTDCTT